MGGYKKIGEMLVEDGVINCDVVGNVIREQRHVKMRFGDILINNRLASEDDIAKVLSRQHGLKYADVSRLTVMPEALLVVREDMARRYSILPVGIENKTITIVTSDPLNVEYIKEIEFHSGRRVNPLIGSRHAISEAIRYHYRFERSIGEINGLSPPAGSVLDVTKSELSAPVITLVNMLLLEAAEGRASDIHIEPSKDSVTVRFRIDGVLIEKAKLPVWIHGPMTSRLKILSRLNIAERRLPQDGGFRIRLGEKDVDIRVSTMPLSHGEKTVVRVLDQAQTMVSLEHLGMSQHDYSKTENLIQRKKGIILVTGPTGSGKTTTLYAVINKIMSGMVNIVTVEDPIEYNIHGINQVQVRSEIGLTFAKCLRSILRQDPDVILIGEIRDEETAEIAFRAAMTGHLVLSTLHTNDAASTITRLVDIGIPKYIIASTVIGIIAQRLVRRLCVSCYPSPLRGEGKACPFDSAQDRPERSRRSEVRVGCYACNRTGYIGRTGVFEIFTVTPGVRELIVSGGTEGTIRQAAAGEGMRSLLDDAFEKVREGITTPEEICRVIEKAIST